MQRSVKEKERQGKGAKELYGFGVSGLSSIRVKERQGKGASRNRSVKEKERRSSMVKGCWGKGAKEQKCNGTPTAVRRLERLESQET